MTKLYMVLWDDAQSICAPMAWDDDCEGALCSFMFTGDSVALFPSRKAARKAIDISTKWAALNRAQGKIANDDFLEPGKRNLRIVECRLAASGK